MTTPNSEPDEGFFSRLWHEVEPVLIHTLVAGSIAVLVSLLLLFLGKVLPEEIAHELHKIDNLLMLGIFWSLAIYTLSLLVLRLTYHLIKEGIQLYRRLVKAVKEKADNTNEGELRSPELDAARPIGLGEFRQPTQPVAAQAQSRSPQETPIDDK